MDWSQQPPLPPLAADRTIGGLRRGLLTAMIAGMLLIGGGVAAVAAASPEPSSSTTPSGEVAPSDDGTTNPSTENRSDHDCPDREADSESDATSS